MPLQSTGAISFSDIQTEFGGVNPIEIDEYYQNSVTTYTSGVAGIPNTSVAISLNMFYSKSKLNNEPVQSIVAGTDVYLRGKYILIGCNQYGTLGGYNAITGLNPSVSLSSSTPAIVFNPNELSSISINPDYTFPGTPVDGWVLGVNSSINITNDRGGTNNLIGSVTNKSSGILLKSEWIGTYTANSLNITIKIIYEFNNTDTYYKFTYTITNNTSTALSNVMFVKTLDPDNDQYLGGSYTTLNGANNTTNIAMAYAISTGGNLLNSARVPTIYIASKEGTISQGGYGGFSISNAYSPGYNFTTNVGSELSGDIAIGVRTSIGTINGNSSVTKVIYIGYWNSTTNPPNPTLPN